MLMKSIGRKLLLSGLVATGLLGAVACGGKDDANVGGSGSESAKDLSADLAALQDELAKLKTALEGATTPEEVAKLEAQISDLQDTIDALKDQIAVLETPGCGEGGECLGLSSSAEALTPLFSTMCEQMYSCCTSSMLGQAMNANVTDAASCTSMMVERYKTGYTFDYDQLAYGLYMQFDLNLPDVGSLVSSLESGRVLIDEEAVAACADLIAKTECDELDELSYGSYGYGYGSYYGYCGDSSENLCDSSKFFVPAAKLGEPCNDEADLQECVDGTYCSGDYGSSTCVLDAVVGKTCFNMYDCWGSTMLYCDADSGTCQEPGELGDSCAFASSNPYYSSPQTKPCGEGLQCSVFSLTCVDSCGEDAHCGSDYDCKQGFICDTDVPDKGGVPGQCVVDSRGDLGDACESYSDCKSNSCMEMPSGDFTCSTGCDTDSDCGDGYTCYDEYYCIPKAANSEACSQWAETPCAAAGDVCVDDGDAFVCMTPVSAGGSCPTTGEADASLVCPSGQFCDEGTCTNFLALDADCSSNIDCGPNAFCSGTCMARAAKGEDCAETPCADGLMCTSYYDGDGDLYVCVTPTDRAEGEICGSANRDGTDKCADGLICRWFDGSENYATCQTGIAIGGACDVSEAWSESANSSRNVDPCADGAYCKRTDFSGSDFSGVCTARIPAGGLCDQAYPYDFSQCADDQLCSYGSWASPARCEAKVSYEEAEMCPIYGYSVEGGYYEL